MASPASNKLRTMVVMGSTRLGRNGDRVGKFYQDIIKARSTAYTHEVDYVDLAEENLPLMENAVAYLPKEKVTKQLANLTQRVAAADAYIFISPEYNHSVGPALLNFVNHFPLPGYAFKPSALAVYSMGPFGGVRAAMQMRALTGELGCIAVNKLFAAPTVHITLDKDGKPQGDNGKLLVSLANQQLDQLEWLADAMKKQRASVKPPQ